MNLELKVIPPVQLIIASVLMYSLTTFFPHNYFILPISLQLLFF